MLATVLVIISGVSAILHYTCDHTTLMVWTAVQGVLLPHEVQLLMNHEHHKPNFVLAVLTQVVDNLPTSDARKQAMDASLTSFHQAVGSCERMVKTPIPRSYTRLVLGNLPWCLSLLIVIACLRHPSLFFAPWALLIFLFWALWIAFPFPLCPVCLFLAQHVCSTLGPSFSPPSDHPVSCYCVGFHASAVAPLLLNFGCLLPSPMRNSADNAP